MLRTPVSYESVTIHCRVKYSISFRRKTQNNKIINLKTNTIMEKVSKETKREHRYNANLHNIFVKAQKEIVNK